MPSARHLYYIAQTDKAISRIKKILDAPTPPVRTRYIYIDTPSRRDDTPGRRRRAAGYPHGRYIVATVDSWRVNGRLSYIVEAYGPHARRVMDDLRQDYVTDHGAVAGRGGSQGEISLLMTIDSDD